MENELLSSLITKKEFSKLVEDAVKEKKMPYMDAILYCAITINLEIESAAKMVNKVIKEKLEVEAEDLNMMQKTISRLPL